MIDNLSLLNSIAEVLEKHPDAVVTIVANSKDEFHKWTFNEKVEAPTFNAAASVPIPGQAELKALALMKELGASNDVMEGFDKDGRYFNIAREKNPELFYIIVNDKCGSTMYDGWWSENTTDLKSAVMEALKGSKLV